jgi:predicted lipid-binding transport protein (Tim44 family)
MSWTRLSLDLGTTTGWAVSLPSGQIVSGSSTDPVKFLEYWTFSRNVGEKNWVLAGITQEGER